MGVRVAVAGASGYAGGELLRLIAAHPDLELGPVTAGSNAGAPVTAVHPHLAEFADRTFEETDPDRLASADLVFLALHHEQSAAIAARLPAEVAVIDLSASFRLSDPGNWAAFYRTGHAGRWVYGLPELPGAREQIVAARRVAAPGCYATAIILALTPLLASGVAEPDDVVVVAASGTSGAGRTPTQSLLATEVMGSVSAYQVGGVHRHTPEIEQAFAEAAGVAATVSFTPLLAPMPRGILATCTARLAPAADASGGRQSGRPARYRRPGRAPRGAGQRIRLGAVHPGAARGTLAEHRVHGRVQRGAPAGRGRRPRRAGRGRGGPGQPGQGGGRASGPDRQPHARPARSGRPNRQRSRTMNPAAAPTPGMRP